MTQLPPAMLALLVLSGLALSVWSIMSAAKPSRTVWIIMGMVLATSLGIQVDWAGRLVPTIFTPIQIRRSLIYLALGIALYPVVVGLFTQDQITRPAGSSWLLMAIATYAGMLRILHGAPFDGLQTLGFAYATLLPLVIVMPSFLQEWHDWYRLLRIVTIANALWILGVLVQLGVRPGAIIVSQSGRFLGLMGNPQHSAVYLSIMSVVVLWLLLNDPQRRYWLCWVILLGINIPLLLWTGSRTGMLMLISGGTVVLYRRIGRAILLVPVVVLLGVVAFELMKSFDIVAAAERLTSTKNTRARIWGVLFREGFQNPLIGVGFEAMESQDASENSYLLGWSAYGIGMVALLACLIGAAVQQSIKLIRIRPLLGDQAPWVELVIAYYPMFFLGAIFEGYIMARVGITLLFLVIVGSLGSLLVRLGAWQASESAYDELWQEDQSIEFGEEDTSEWIGGPAV